VQLYPRERSPESNEFGLVITLKNGQKSISTKNGKLGYILLPTGVQQFFGPLEGDNYKLQKRKDGVVIKTFTSDGSLEYDYPNGAKKYTTVDGQFTSPKPRSERNSVTLGDWEAPINTNYTDNRDRFANIAALVSHGLQLADSIESIIKAERLEQNSARSEQDLLRLVSKVIVCLSFLSAAAISIFVLMNFVRQIIIRVRVLNQNAAGLSRLKKSTNRLDGNDELTYLDRVFQETEEELAEAAEQHKQIMQMVAHDMRSPIMAMQIYIEVFQDITQELLQDTAAQWCDNIKTGSNRVLAFVTDLLTLERLESGGVNLQPAEISLKEIVDECSSSNSLGIDAKEIVIENHCQIDSISADRERIKQVIAAYLAIAVKCAAPRSIVLVESERTFDTVKLSVTENSGSWTSSTNKTFGRFQLPQDRDENSEFRLPLATAKVLIEAHGGEVGALSAPGVGSKFWFSLPIHRLAAAEPTEAATNNKISFHDLLKPGLVRHAFVIALFPLLLQAGWLIWLNLQLDESERLDRIEKRQSDLIAVTSDIILSEFRANSGMAASLVQDDPISRDLALKNFNLLDQQIVQLDKLIPNNGDQNRAWNDLREFVQLELEQMKKTLAGGKDQGNAGLTEMGLVLNRAGDLLSRIPQVMAEDLKQLAVIQSNQEQFRMRVQNLIVLTIPLNIAFSLALLWLFNRKIANRLFVVVENARKLPGRGTLNQALKGTDEIANLDVLLHNAADELAKSDQLRRGMMDIVAHDIRSPLVAVETSLGRLEQSVSSGLETKAADCLKSVRNNVNRVLTLADDLLMIDSLKDNNIEIKIKPCSLLAMAKDAADSIRSLAQAKKIEIVIDCPDLTIYLDDQRMMQVLINLLTNAIKFSDNNTKITIGARKLKGGLQLFIEDEGKGMDPETASKVFEKYVTGKQKEKAFGLGLAICKLIVTAHEGTISVDSQIGRGSTFFIFIPRALDASSCKHESPA
jgi:signal transduction histidine kinase